MATFVSDTFTDTDGTALTSHTGETGATWTNHPNRTGVFKISNANRCYPETDSQIAEAYASGSPASANYYVQATVYQVSDTGRQAGVLARMDTSATTYYRARYVSGSLDQVQLHKVVAGTATQLGSSYGISLSNGTSFLLRLNCDGDQISVDVDGTTRIGAVTDTAITSAGKAGVYGFGPSSSSVGEHLDNFAAVDIGGGGGGLSIPVAMHHYRSMRAA